MAEDDQILHVKSAGLSCEVWEFVPDDNDNDKVDFPVGQTHELHAGNGTEQYSWPLPSDSCGADADIMSSFNSPPIKLSASTSPCSISRGDLDVSPNNTNANTTATRAGRRETHDNDNTNQSTCDASVSSKKRCLHENNNMSADHETHIWTERERRKKMRTMFSSLHSLLPHLPIKTDKSTIVDEAICYIKSLQKSLQVLQNQKLEKTRPVATKEFRSFELQDSTEPVVDYWRRTYHSTSSSIDHTLQTWSSPNVVLSVCGGDAQIGICSAYKPGLLSTIFYTLEKHNVDVLTAHISGDTYRCMCMIHAHAATEAAIEAFKLVIGDLVMYFSSL